MTFVTSCYLFGKNIAIRRPTDNPDIQTVRHAIHFALIGWMTFNWATTGKRSLDLFRIANRQPPEPRSVACCRMPSKTLHSALDLSFSSTSKEGKGIIQSFCWNGCRSWCEIAQFLATTEDQVITSRVAQFAVIGSTAKYKKINAIFCSR